MKKEEASPSPPHVIFTQGDDSGGGDDGAREHITAAGEWTACGERKARLGRGSSKEEPPTQHICNAGPIDNGQTQI